MRKQFIYPTTRAAWLAETVIATSTPIRVSNEDGGPDADAPARGKTPVPTSVNEVLSQTADQK